MNAEDNLETSLSALDNKGYGICYAYWKRLKAERWAPAWADWQWADLPPELVQNFMIVDVQPEPLDFIFRFWGTAFQRLHNIEMTNKSVHELRSPGTARNSFDQYAEVAKTRRPHLFSYPIQMDRDRKRFDHPSLRMPFSDDGQNVNLIVTFADWRKDLYEVRQEHVELFAEKDSAHSVL